MSSTETLKRELQPIVLGRTEFEHGEKSYTYEISAKVTLHIFIEGMRSQVQRVKYSSTSTKLSIETLMEEIEPFVLGNVALRIQKKNIVKCSLASASYQLWMWRIKPVERFSKTFKRSFSLTQTLIEDGRPVVLQ